MHLPWTSLLPMSAVMLLGWWWQQRHQNATLVDVLWAFLMAIAGLYYAVSGAADWPVRVLIGSLMGLWYGSLGWHLLRRMQGQPEDGRYHHLRLYWGEHAGRWHFAFFQMQALFAWVFTLPVWFVSGHDLAIAPVTNWQLVTATLLVLGAWWGQRLADAQLTNFRQTPGNHAKVCCHGLWRYSRHPNYFFEWLQWFVWPLLAWQYPHGAWLLLAPIIMWLFLYWVTGIPYTEQQALRSRGDAYRAYQQSTSPFIPWRPRP